MTGEIVREEIISYTPITFRFDAVLYFYCKFSKTIQVWKIFAACLLQCSLQGNMKLHDLPGFILEIKIKTIL